MDRGLRGELGVSDSNIIRSFEKNGTTLPNLSLYKRSGITFKRTTLLWEELNPNLCDTSHLYGRDLLI